MACTTKQPKRKEKEKTAAATRRVRAKTLAKLKSPSQSNKGRNFRKKDEGTCWLYFFQMLILISVQFQGEFFLLPYWATLALFGASARAKTSASAPAHFTSTKISFLFICSLTDGKCGKEVEYFGEALSPCVLLLNAAA